MNPAEQTVTWLITLGVLESPKKNISDPEAFLLASLRDGVVLCRLMERLRPGAADKVYQEPKNDSECLSNIREFLKGCSSFRVEPFEATDLLQAHNFNKVLLSLVALNKVTAGEAWVQQLLKDMSENSSAQLVVKARFNFQQTNEDELSFSKGDIIHVTRTEDGGWWEGTLSGKTGWFPSNYVREVKGCDKPVSPKSGTLKSPPKGFDTTAISKTYYNLVLQNILETETEYSKDLQNLLSNYLRPLQSTEKLNSSDISIIMGNLEMVSSFQQTLVQSLEECSRLPEVQQKVGGFFLNLMPQMRTLYVSYCSNHPSAVNVLTEHSEVLSEFMEGKGASSPGILTLTTGLSKPFMRLDKYPNLLKELERHMEEGHPDRMEIQRCMTTFKNLSLQCQEVRKRKELELQILTETIRLWEGEDIHTLGSVLYMSQAMVQSHSAEERLERYLLLFPHVLLILSASPRMSGFIYQGKLPLTGMTVTKQEDCENFKNAFELSGTMFEKIQVVCFNQQDLQDWLEHLTRQTKHTTMTAPTFTYHFILIWKFSEDAQILKVIEAYCTSAKTRQTLNSSKRDTGVPVLFPVDEETKSNGQAMIEENLSIALFSLKDNKKIKRSLEEEQRARKDLEKVVRKVLKNMNDPSWDETNL
uniref:Rho guanine nucleotide exchange factor (GEF) 7a n=1 Tax=Denticeps clupeoides TaxID=299321 RepID=A0AAY4DUS8_9TELE